MALLTVLLGFVYGLSRVCLGPPANLDAVALADGAGEDAWKAGDPSSNKDLRGVFTHYKGLLLRVSYRTLFLALSITLSRGALRGLALPSHPPQAENASPVCSPAQSTTVSTSALGVGPPPPQPSPSPP